jgi:lipopolysaccharide transport system ATP-binding protein
MPAPIISVENLSKRYLVGHQAHRGEHGTYTALRDVIGREIHNIVRKAVDVACGRQVVEGADVEEFWALRYVSFQAQQGEVLGIIGRNGAGKSTLLKVLSRITEPTAGRVTLRGRVASLIEVGTGFHPELTGSENIYLNGAILGMSRAEIRRKFDEIVAFAEIEKFLDTPVKHYSSGMYMRLAFAVAAHLESEILIIDEILAVGDIDFQKKCLGKMGDVSRREGRTVLLVSHNMAVIQNLCARAILLDTGELRLDGSAASVTEAYLRPPEADRRSFASEQRRPPWAKKWITNVRTLDEGGSECSTFGLGENIIVELEFEGSDTLHNPVLGIVINHRQKGEVGTVNTRMTGFQPPRRNYSSGVYRCNLIKPPLLQGMYSVDVWLGDGSDDVDALFGMVDFMIGDRDIYGTGITPFKHLGVMFFESSWSIETQSTAPERQV